MAADEHGAGGVIASDVIAALPHFRDGEPDTDDDGAVVAPMQRQAQQTRHEPAPAPPETALPWPPR